VKKEEAAEVGPGDDAREALGHADADAGAAEGVFNPLVVFFEPAEEASQGGQVAFDARFLERDHVEEVADVVVDDGLVAGGDGGAFAEELGEAGQVELVGADGVGRELPDRLAVADERGCRVSEQHVVSTSNIGGRRTLSEIDEESDRSSGWVDARECFSRRFECSL
jgi:hypothetical protein